MSNYYVLTYDDREDLMVVTDHDLGSFPVMTFWTGTPFGGSIPNHVRLQADRGAPADYVANPISWQIVSAPLRDAVLELSPDDVQSFPLPLYPPDGDEPLTGYHVLNVTRTLDAAVTPPGRKGPMLQGLTLDAARIPADAHIFRLSFAPTVIVVSEAMRPQLRRAPTGIALLKIALR